MSTTPKVKAPDTLKEQIAQLNETLAQARNIATHILIDRHGMPVTPSDLIEFRDNVASVDVSIEGSVFIRGKVDDEMTLALEKLPRLHY